MEKMRASSQDLDRGQNHGDQGSDRGPSNGPTRSPRPSRRRGIRRFTRERAANATDITFPDIKVGDMVNVRGAVQGGNFLATNLTIMEPRDGGGQDRFGGGHRVAHKALRFADATAGATGRIRGSSASEQHSELDPDDATRCACPLFLSPWSSRRRSRRRRQRRRP